MVRTLPPETVREPILNLAGAAFVPAVRETGFPLLRLVYVPFDQTGLVVSGISGEKGVEMVPWTWLVFFMAGPL